MRTPMYLAAFFTVLLGCSADTVTNLDVNTVVPHSGFFVTIDGSQTGDGSSDHPWSLATALAQPGIVKPGDTIWLHGGTYKGPFTSTLTGTATDPVILRAYPGERATIDGRLDITGQYAYYWGFEVTDSDPNRVSAIAGSRPSDLPRNLVTVFVTGSFNKLINLSVHDMGDGMFASSDAEGVEIYGSMFYNNGWIGPDRGHGHNIYLQNQNPTKYVTDNVLFNSFDVGLHIYGTDIAYLWNFHIEGNTIFDSGDPAVAVFGTTAYDILHTGGAGHLGRSAYIGNSIYHRDGRDAVVVVNTVGSLLPGEDLEFSKNIVHGRTQFNEMKRYVVTGNKFTNGSEVLSASFVLLGLRIVAGESYSSLTWNSNSYATPVGGTRDPFYMVNPNGQATTVYTFPTWQSTTGYDAAGSFVSGQFTGADIIVRPNRYEPGRAFVTVWNWDGASALNVDLSNVLRPGDRFEIHHVFDVFGAPVVSGTYGGGSVSIPQTTPLPPTPLGYTASPALPDNRFNVFLVEKR